MKKYRSILLVILLIASLALCGTVFAYMFRQTEAKNNQFIPAEVSCEVKEAFDGTDKKTSIKVQNTGNIKAYLRVSFVSYWVDSSGNVVSKPSVMPSFEIKDGWIKKSPTEDVYYYTKPVAPTQSTDELLNSNITLTVDENGYLQVVDVFAEAIQSTPKDAVEGSWGVSIDSNGNISL